MMFMESDGLPSFLSRDMLDRFQNLWQRLLASFNLALDSTDPVCITAEIISISNGSNTSTQKKPLK